MLKNPWITTFFMKQFSKFIILRKYLNVIIVIIVVFASLVSNKIYSNYSSNEIKALSKVLRNTYLNKTLLSVIDNLNPRFQNVVYRVNAGDTFQKILINLNLNEEERKVILKNLTKKKKILKLYENQIIEFKIDRQKPIKIVEINLPISKSKNLVILRKVNKNEFIFREIEKNLKKIVNYKESKITNSLYASATNQDIPANLIIEFARIYGFQFDFQRDIWKNDTFQIIYETFISENEKIVETGNIIFANLILKGKEFPLYFYEEKNFKDHFDERGQSIKKTLMKTPINGARLSSKFGKRKHPILGFTKMHSGTDFAAPTGTPIMASGDGVVTKASWCGGGGNCVKIRHNSTYSTIYAHMSKFGRGIKKGTRVKQGQIIGYVGSTGLSTGPHLHYEVVENGKKINSQTLKLPSGKVLKGEQRKNFEISKIKINVLKSELIFSN